MAQLFSIERTGQLSWSDSFPTLLASGTVANTVGEDFRSTASLEIFSTAKDLRVIGSVSTELRFHKLAWSPCAAFPDHSLGLIAGGMADGSICLWDPAKIIENLPDEALISTLSKHTGPVLSLAFNLKDPSTLASGGADGDVYIWDLKSSLKEPNVAVPAPGTKCHSADVTGLAWNRKVPRILGSTSADGKTIVWDTATKHPTVTLQDTTADKKLRNSALAWNPDVATQLAIASDDDRQTVVQLWDLRNSRSPYRTLRHGAGVLSVSWCPDDSSILLTAGKDNRVVCWNAQSGEQISELPPFGNWPFDVQWAPRHPALVSVSSFDGKVSLFSLHDVAHAACQPDATAFPPASPQAVANPPKWRQRRVGATFGFAGKLVHFGMVTDPATKTQHSALRIDQVAPESASVDAQRKLLQTVESGDWAAFCAERAEQDASFKESWNLAKILLQKAPRTELLHFLGYNPEEIRRLHGADPVLPLRPPRPGCGPRHGRPGRCPAATAAPAAAAPAPEAPKPEEPAPLPAEGEKKEEEKPATPEAPAVEAEKPAAEEAAAPAAPADEHPEETDRLVTDCLLTGNLRAAVNLCQKAGRMADALVIASHAGPLDWKGAVHQYFKSSKAPFNKLLEAILNEDVPRYVAQLDTPARDWRQALALLASYVKGDQFAGQCAALARQLEKERPEAALVLHLCAGNVQQSLEAWGYCGENKSVTGPPAYLCVCLPTSARLFFGCSARLFFGCSARLLFGCSDKSLPCPSLAALSCSVLFCVACAVWRSLRMPLCLSPLARLQDSIEKLSVLLQTAPASQHNISAVVELHKQYAYSLAGQGLLQEANAYLAKILPTLSAPHDVPLKELAMRIKETLRPVEVKKALKGLVTPVDKPFLRAITPGLPVAPSRVPGPVGMPQPVSMGVAAPAPAPAPTAASPASTVSAGFLPPMPQPATVRSGAPPPIPAHPPDLQPLFNGTPRTLTSLPSQAPPRTRLTCVSVMPAYAPASPLVQARPSIPDTTVMEVLERCPVLPKLRADPQRARIVQCCTHLLRTVTPPLMDQNTASRLQDFAHKLGLLFSQLDDPTFDQQIVGALEYLAGNIERNEYDQALGLVKQIIANPIALKWGLVLRRLVESASQMAHAAH
ncbi:putative Protein transport protein SEC31 [Paratrimastix pyriformis]|uniref:Sec16 Sec23-binding domain-containing protein n=1 Tax=Paratrimastix pyriformis TaxID=342808 RepID=A0ABQ8ULS4_9EUKA|nr:putative Protein transport protein SEC31 [Paratrimastix pyriformis]